MNIDKRVRIIIILQLVLFLLGASTHAGKMPFGYMHVQAMRAESVIAVVLFLGLIGTVLKAPLGRRMVLGTQIFGLLGTCVGLVMILIGIGPRSTFDYALHAGMITSFLINLKFIFKR